MFVISKKMSLITLIIKIIFFGPMALAFPYLIDYKNSPQILTKDKSVFVLKKLNQFVVPSFIITAKFDELKMVLPFDYQVHINSNSKVEFPEVHVSDTKPQIIHLISGELRLKSDQNTKNSPLHIIKTAFFDLPVPQIADVLITVNMSEPSVVVKMIKGEWNLEYFAYEKKVKLMSGQMIKFKGQLSDDQRSLKFDYLLDQRKVPKGKLEEIESFDIKKFVQDEAKVEKEIIMKHKKLLKIKNEEIKKKKEYEDSFLCKKPLAQVNQCAWVLENGKCFRKRCNVSGQWGDLAERPIDSYCTQDYLVGACDY